MSVFTAVVVQDRAGGYVGHVPGWPGAHSQGETLDELHGNLREVVELLLVSGAPEMEAQFVGTLNVEVE